MPLQEVANQYRSIDLSYLVNMTLPATVACKIVELYLT